MYSGQNARSLCNLHNVQGKLFNLMAGLFARLQLHSPVSSRVTAYQLWPDIQKSARDCIQLIQADHNLIRCLVASAPLLGLLGTVWGMIETFDVISVVGTSEPGMLAGGISKAMITTQAGLTVAVPAIFVEKRLSRWEAWISHQIEETSLVLIQCVDDSSNS